MKAALFKHAMLEQGGALTVQMAPSPLKQRKHSAPLFLIPSISTATHGSNFMGQKKFSHLPGVSRYAAVAASDAPTPPAAIQTTVEYKFTVKNICELVISGDLEGPEGMGAASIVALYHYYLSKSRNLSAAVLSIIEKHPELKSKLGHGDGNKLLEKLESYPDGSLGLLNSMKDLIMLCRTAAPHVAKEIEQEMKLQVEKEREKAASASETVSSDTPSAVMAALGGDHAAMEGNGPSAAQPSVGLANRIIKGNKWENWKYRLRSALIASTPPTHSTPSAKYVTKFSIESRTSDDTDLVIWQEVGASGPGLASLATKGPDDAAPAMRSFLLLQFLEQPEAGMLDVLSGVIWKVAQLKNPRNFTCTFFSKEDNSGIKSGSDRAETVLPFVLKGTGDELKVLLMVLAGLEGEEIPGGKKALTSWIPAKERIQLRRRRRGGYAFRATLREEGVIDEIVLETKQIRGLIDCLDAFCELNPAFGLKEPQMEVPPATVLQNIAAALHL